MYCDKRKTSTRQHTRLLSERFLPHLAQSEDLELLHPKGQLYRFPLSSKWKSQNPREAVATQLPPDTDFWDYRSGRDSSRVSVGKTSISTAGVHTSRVGMRVGRCSVQPLHLPHRERMASPPYVTVMGLDHCACARDALAISEQAGDILPQEDSGDGRPYFRWL